MCEICNTMSIAPWLNPRSRRFDRSRSEDAVKLDLTAEPSVLAKEILSALCTSDLPEGRLLSYLNNFVKLILHISGNLSLLGFTIKDILVCLRYCVINEASSVRAGAFRAMRHVISKEEDVAIFNELLIPYLVVRSLDLEYKYDGVRVEAVKLARKVLLIAPASFQIAFTKYLVSLANGSIEEKDKEKDRMLRVYLAILCEIGTLNPESFIAGGGVAAITRNLLECQTPKISESLCGVLLLLLDNPVTRKQANVDLHCVAAPYCDFHYKHGWLDKNRDERELKFNCSRLALLSILKSWPGILHFCSPKDVSGFKAIVDVLYLDQLEVRKAVLDLLYELLNLPQPEWTDELSVALSAIDPAEPQNSWRISEDFVAAEGRSILPHLARTTPSISDMHLSLLLYCFLEMGLLGSLSEVIATSDTFISVRATVLLGELLRLIQVLLPPECCNISPALPTLIDYATTNRPQALRAITALQHIHKLLKRRPASYSLYLDYILRSGTTIKTSSRPTSSKKYKSGHPKSKLTQLVIKDGDDAIKDTGVLLNKDAFTWNWNAIQIILKRESDFVIDLTDANHRSFLKRLVEYFTPSSNRYSHMDLTSPKNSQGYTTAGIDLIDCLTHMVDPICDKLLSDLFRDISQQIGMITEGKSAHDCLFSPQHMINTQCQTYFLFIGRLGSTKRGAQLNEELKLFDKLKHLATTTDHLYYVKLIISSLDYCENPKSIEMLSAVLRCPNEYSRLYATQFLLVLLRAKLPNFSKWGIKLLAGQLADKFREVYLSALNTLHEACELTENLETLIRINPPLLHLEEKGALLLIRYLSVPSGFKSLQEKNFVINELKRWDDYFNCRYVVIIEGETADALTQLQKGEDGRYIRRSTSSRTATRQDVFLPPHLYGQLAKHPEGLKVLVEHGSIPAFLQIIQNRHIETEAEIVRLKSALWALGHTCSSVYGLEYIANKNILPHIVDLAEQCIVWSIRATAFYTLGLIATTRYGADCLFKLGWVSTRHDRHERWPVIHEDHWKINQELTMEISDPDYYCDLYMPDAEGSTIEDENIFVGENFLPYRKSSTLPHSYNTSVGQHTRSLSESKTFEVSRNVKKDPKENLPHRYRDNSITESTTSGVSSCESALGKSIFNEANSNLTPIASISSLQTIKTGVRRYSESSRMRMSSDRSTVSPAGSNVGQLSFQDHMGYKIIRHIKMGSKENDEEFDKLLPTLHRVQSLDRQRYRSGSEDSYSLANLDGQSFMSMSSVSTFRVRDDYNKEKGAGQIYMGICLPVTLLNLFPEIPVSETRLCFNDNSTLLGSNAPAESDSSACAVSSPKQSIFVHETKDCFNCSYQNSKEISSSSSNQETTDEPDSKCELLAVKNNILNQIEMLSNPLICKQHKHNLLNIKQKHPQLFQDVCLYADVCKLLAENSYRLMTRRFIQDIFFDTSFDVFSKDFEEMFSIERAPLTSPEEPVISKVKSYQELATEQRKAELVTTVPNEKDKVADAVKPKKVPNVLSVVVGFDVQQQQNANDIISPTKYQPSSPSPLTSVKEENIASSNENIENVPSQSQVEVHWPTQSSIANRKTEDTNKTTQYGNNSAIKTLDQLNLTYKENKFPIKRDDKNVVT